MFTIHETITVNIVYLLMCNKCNYGYYVGETSTKFRLRMYYHKKSIRDNHKGLLVAVHCNQADHSINDISCAMLNGIFTTTADIQLYEQKLIQRFDSNKCGLNRDLGFLSKYFFQMVIAFLLITLKTCTSVQYFHL